MEHKRQGSYTMKRNTILLALCLCALPVLGCATQTEAIREMHTTATTEGFPMTTILHAEKVKQGLHLQLGPDQSSLIKLFVGSDDLFVNATTAPLGEDSFYWQHVNKLDAEVDNVDGSVSGQTLIRIDKPEYLGPVN